MLTEALTTMTSGVMVKRDTGINSWFRRQHGSGLSASPFALLISARNKVCRSGAARAVSRAAIMPLAPGRFSTITGWPRDSVSLAPICRARMSGELPAGEGTRMRIGFEGKDCAAAVPANAARTHARICFIGEPFAWNVTRNHRAKRERQRPGGGGRIVVHATV